MNYHLLTLALLALFILAVADTQPDLHQHDSVDLKRSVAVQTEEAPSSSKTFPNSGLDYLVLFLVTMMILDSLVHLICLFVLGPFAGAGIDYPM
jgi:hypothetical protein